MRRGNLAMRRAKQSRPKELGDVLVVDDTLANLRLLINLLSAYGYNVRPAQSGPLALAAIEASRPDIILLDINMPEMNGYEVCRRLKADESTRDIPVIFVSALDDTESKLEAFSSGGVDYISKPFQLEEVSIRIKTHLTIRRLQDGLEERNRDLAAFDRSVAHDLRSPLTALLGISELMTMGAEHRSDENVAAVLEAANRMRSIIDSLLLFAQIGNATAEMAPVDMGALVHKVRNGLKLEIQQRQAEVTIEPGEWPVVAGHAPWVEQIWVNYLTNALKYGGAPPRVALAWDMGDGTDPRFMVRDNGPGLTPDQRDLVFDEFRRLHSTRAEEGHGLGLSIVKRVVEKLGGVVGLESEPGRGSQFSFTLKLLDTQSSADSRELSAPTMALRS